MKKILLILLFVSLFSQISAQEFRFGIFGGVNVNTMELSPDCYINNDIESTEKLMSLGFRGGFSAEYIFGEHLGLQTDLFYAQYGYRLINEIKFVGENSKIVLGNKEERVTHDISLSLMLKYYLFDQKIALDLGVMPSCTYMVRAFTEETLSIDSMNVNFSCNTLTDSTYIIGRDEGYNMLSLSAIGGLTYYVSDNVYFSMRYVYGLTDLFFNNVGEKRRYNNNEKTDVLSRNRVIQLGLGLRF